MQINFFTHGKAIAAKISGELDHHAAARIKDDIDRRIICGHKNLVLDLSDLNFMDSSGIGVILGRYKLICGCGGEMAIIAGNNKNVKKILEMSGIPRLIKIYDNFAQLTENKRSDVV